MVQRFAGLLARLEDAHKAQVHSGDAFKWCDAAYLKCSSHQHQYSLRQLRQPTAVSFRGADRDADVQVGD